MRLRNTYDVVHHSPPHMWQLVFEFEHNGPIKEVTLLHQGSLKWPGQPQHKVKQLPSSFGVGAGVGDGAGVEGMFTLCKVLAST
mmetsp:Transcript_66454/g.216285  ORF Transcript_66454/g.216285 Transcript_66454/m.216285 type:complete len:84 (+) Transcript_66454:179-430(+)